MSNQQAYVAFKREAMRNKELNVPSYPQWLKLQEKLTKSEERREQIIKGTKTRKEEKVAEAEAVTQRRARVKKPKVKTEKGGE